MGSEQGATTKAKTCSPTAASRSSRPSPNGSGAQAFSFARRDADADTSTSTATFNVNAGDIGPITRPDRVLTNDPASGAAFAIPDAWLLYNDVDPDGDVLSVAAVANSQDGTASHGGSTATFTDNDADGGSFEYTAQSNLLTDTAKVTINRSQAGETVLDGTDLADILIVPSGGSTLNGLGGADVLAGGNGADTLNGGNGDDLVDGRGNFDLFTGGRGDDTVNVSDGNDLVRYTSTLDGTDTLTGFDGDGGVGAQDQLTLDSLFDSLGVAAADRAGRVQIVSGGSSSDVYVNADTSNPDFELHVATIFTTDSITVGSGADIDVGS